MRLRRRRGRAARRRLAAVGALASALVLLVQAGPAAAHGVGGRLDLPVPAWQLAWAASFAVAASFVALGMFWEEPRLRAAAAGRILPRPTQTACRALALMARIAGLLALGVLVYAGLWGNTNASVNIAPVAVYIVFWVGLQAVSVLLGDVWRALNPFATLADGAAWLRARAKSRPISAADRGAGNQWWAVAAIFGFVWIELAFHDNAEPRVLGIYVTAYTAAMLLGAAVFGRGWVRDAEGFGVLFTKLAGMAPLHRGDGSRSPGSKEPGRSSDDGAADRSTAAFRLRPPLAGLAVLPERRGAAAFILVVLGSTTFDGFTRSGIWLDVAADRTGWGLTAVNTVGLVFVISAVVVLYRAAIAAMAAITGDRERELADLFVPSLIPIAAAYTVAHYFSYLLLEGQQIIALVSDPFGRGWDLFGTAGHRVDYTLISTDTIAWTQTAAIAVGHVLGVAVAHDRAVERWPRRLAMRSQYPMLAVMILYTIVGLFLLLGV